MANKICRFGFGIQLLHVGVRLRTDVLILLAIL